MFRATLLGLTGLSGLMPVPGRAICDAAAPGKVGGVGRGRTAAGCIAVLWVLQDKLELGRRSEGDTGVIGREARLAVTAGDPRLLGRAGGVGMRWDGGNDGRASHSMAPPVFTLLVSPLSVFRDRCPCETVAPLVGTDPRSIPERRGCTDRDGLDGKKTSPCQLDRRGVRN